MTNVIQTMIEDKTYQYISIWLGVLCLVPQTWKAWSSRSMNDVSGLSLSMMFVSGILWCLYMYDTKRILFFPATVFLTTNSLILIFMKCHYYREKVLASMARLENPTSIVVT